MKNIIFIFLALFLFACGKKEKDIVTHHDLKGMVFNQCTDLGLAGVNVSLNINDSKNISSYGTISDLNGEFAFPNTLIHSSSKYSYAISIPSKSGIGGTEVGFNGTTMYFNSNEADTYFKPKVTPKFLNWCFQITPTVFISAPDSIIVTFQQNIFHKNVPELPYKSKQTQTDLQNGFLNCTFGNYPMGLWNIIINKWKSGIYTTSIDSIYLPWGSTKTYTINW